MCPDLNTIFLEVEITLETLESPYMVGETINICDKGLKQQNTQHACAFRQYTEIRVLNQLYTSESVECLDVNKKRLFSVDY